MDTRSESRTREVTIPLDGLVLHGDLTVPPDARGVVIFAHGTGSSRSSPRNRAVAATLVEGGFATLLLDLLQPDEERVDAVTRQHRFDIERLATRLAGATLWVTRQPATRLLPVGYFGASTGAAAALVAAARLRDVVRAVVSRGGRPDLAGPALRLVRAPTLLIVGGGDAIVLDLNQDALAHLGGWKTMDVVPGASHLFEEPGTLDEVARLARQWFAEHLAHAPVHAPVASGSARLDAAPVVPRAVAP